MCLNCGVKYGGLWFTDPNLRLLVNNVIGLHLLVLFLYVDSRLSWRKMCTNMIIVEYTHY